MRRLGLLVLTALLALPLTVAAGPITGDIAFGGTFTPLPGPGLDSSTTGIDFNNPALVLKGLGDYSSVPLGTQATFTDFTFSPFNGPVDLWSFTSGGLTYSFTLASLTKAVADTNFLDLAGLGTLFITGFTPTEGTWSLSTDTPAGGLLFEFSSGNHALPSEGEGAVPEPVTLVLFGLGLVGMATRHKARV